MASTSYVSDEHRKNYPLLIESLDCMLRSVSSLVGWGSRIVGGAVNLSLEELKQVSTCRPGRSLRFCSQAVSN